MPKQNGTGPQGFGPGTGWGLGYCGDGVARGRRNFGQGHSLGWRRFWGYYPAPNLSSKEEREILTAEVKLLEEELQAVKDRLAKIKK